MNFWRSRGAEHAGLVALLVVIVGFASPVFDNGFVYDDVQVIERGDIIHDPSQVGALFVHNAMYISPTKRGENLLVDTYRPVTLVSFMWDSLISGRQPIAYHVTNLVMHLLCTVLVFVLVRRIVGADAWLIALFVAAAFGLSPHPSTAHIWINGRSDLFCTFFGIAAILVWRRGVARAPSTSGTLHYLASASLFFAGLLSKEVLIMAIPVLVLWPEPAGVSFKTRLTRTSGFVGAGAAYLLIRMAVLGGMRASEGSDHLRDALAAWPPLQVHGLIGALAPVRVYLRFMTEEFWSLGPAGIGAYAIAVLLAGAWAWRIRGSQPWIAWGLLWFVACLSPVAIVAAIPWPGFGRYLYLPSVGLAVALGWGVNHILASRPSWRRPAVVLALGYLVVLGSATYNWAKDFKDEPTLYLAAIAANPDGVNAYGFLGLAYLAAGDPSEAIGPLSVAEQRNPRTARYAVALLDAFNQTRRTHAATRLATEAAGKFERGAEPFHMHLLNVLHADNPEAAASHVLSCLRKDSGSSACGDALTKLLVQHPNKLHYRRIVDEALKAPGLARLREQTAPLRRSLR